jgi:hypothetical protein
MKFLAHRNSTNVSSFSSCMTNSWFCPLTVREKIQRLGESWKHLIEDFQWSQVGR